ncbi:MAG: kinase [bacterium]|nr:kinase [bacterium]
MSESEAARVEALLDPAAPPDYRRLAARLAVAWSDSRPRRVGLGGGQGAGKSTLGRLIEAACAEVALRAVVIGLDDFYRTRAEREAMAAEMHPLFETRGPPGTHDVTALGLALEALGEPGPVDLPRFDKGLDDRTEGTRVEGPFDLVLLEGWCVGAQAAGIDCGAPAINDLERDRDPDGRWRAEVDVRLARDYEPLWDRLDELVFLQVPDLGAVRRWRLEQESSLPEARRLDRDAVDRFVEFYERITLSMLEETPRRADWTVVLADDHSVARVVSRKG